MHKRNAVIFLFITILLCAVFVIVARQNFNEEYKAKQDEIEATNNQLTIERIRDRNSDSSQMSETEQKATDIWATTTAIYIRDATEFTTRQTATPAP